MMRRLSAVASAAILLSAINVVHAAPAVPQPVMEGSCQRYYNDARYHSATDGALNQAVWLSMSQAEPALANHLFNTGDTSEVVRYWRTTCEQSGMSLEMAAIETFSHFLLE